jgi:tripartite-type tricarboxylate transporter receptor subunit TctC
MFKRIISIAAAAAISLTCFAAPSQAAWPERPVKFMLGSGAGSSIDMVGRLIAQKLSDKYGQPFVPQNVSGGGLGAFAMSLKNAKADGYTIGFGADSFFTYNSLDPKSKFHMEDYEFLCTVFQGDCAYIVAPDKKWKDLREALEASKTMDKPLVYQFQGALDRKIFEVFVKEIGAKVSMVPMQSPSAGVTAVIGGHADIAFAGGLQYEQERAGKIRNLTLSTAKRTPHYPDVPSVLEMFKAQYPQDAYRIIVVPKGFPKDVKEQLAKDLEEIITSAEFSEMVDKKLHFFPAYNNSANTQKILETQMELWKTLY